MAQMLVRDLDPAVMESLRARARRNGRSLEAEARAIFRAAVAADASESLADVERVRALFAGRTFGESTALIREDRER